MSRWTSPTWSNRDVGRRPGVPRDVPDDDGQQRDRDSPTRPPPSPVPMRVAKVVLQSQHCVTAFKDAVVRDGEQQIAKAGQMTVDYVPSAQKWPASAGWSRITFLANGGGADHLLLHGRHRAPTAQWIEISRQERLRSPAAQSVQSSQPPPPETRTPTHQYCTRQRVLARSRRREHRGGRSPADSRRGFKLNSLARIAILFFISRLQLWICSLARSLIRFRASAPTCIHSATLRPPKEQTKNSTDEKRPRAQGGNRFMLRNGGLIPRLPPLGLSIAATGAARRPPVRVITAADVQDFLADLLNIRDCPSSMARPLAALSHPDFRHAAEPRPLLLIALLSTARSGRSPATAIPSYGYMM